MNRSLFLKSLLASIPVIGMLLNRKPTRVPDSDKSGLVIIYQDGLREEGRLLISNGDKIEWRKYPLTYRECFKK